MYENGIEEKVCTYVKNRSGEKIALVCDTDRGYLIVPLNESVKGKLIPKTREDLIEDTLIQLNADSRDIKRVIKLLESLR